MRANPLKEKLLSGKPVVGSFVNLPSPAAVEVLGLLGFDFVIIDTEHGVSDLESCEHMVRAAEVSGIVPLVRVPPTLPQAAARYLDAGALGVQVPLVSSREEAQAVVSAVKYPPLGRRGLAAVRASGFGIPRPLGEYVQQANQETLVVVQVETRQALERAAEIINVEGVDVVFLGPTDISSSLGYPGQTGHPEVLAAIERAGKEAKAAGVVTGTIARDATSYARWRRAGFQYLCTTLTSLLAEAGRGFLAGVKAEEERLRLSSG
jgi:4-hydroxy-2-oxoheptanedioate aldolase